MQLFSYIMITRNVICYKYFTSSTSTTDQW